MKSTVWSRQEWVVDQLWPKGHRIPAFLLRWGGSAYMSSPNHRAMDLAYIIGMAGFLLLCSSGISPGKSMLV